MKNRIVYLLKQTKHFLYLVWTELPKIHISFILNGRERLEPSLVDKNHPYLKSHLNRYLFAKKMVSKDDKVLDLACGTGYGTALLASKAKQVLGVDRSRRAIWFAKNTYRRGNLGFKTGDFFDRFEKYDVVVSFETLEHIKAKTFGQVLTNLTIRSKRLIIGSVPYLEKSGINPFHLWFDLNEKSFQPLKKWGKIVFYFQAHEGRILNKLRVGRCQNLIFVVYKRR